MTALEAERVLRPIRIRPARLRLNGWRFWWECRTCTKRLSGTGRGHAVTIADAADQAREHRLTDCPDAAAASRLLIEAVFLVPDYQAIRWAISGAFPTTSEPVAWLCSRCGQDISDRSAHTSHHLAGSVFA